MDWRGWGLLPIVWFKCGLLGPVPNTTGSSNILLMEALGRMALPIVLLPDFCPVPAAIAVRVPAGAAGVLARRKFDTLRGVFNVPVPAVRFNGVPYCVLDFAGVVAAP